MRPASPHPLGHPTVGDWKAAVADGTATAKADEIRRRHHAEYGVPTRLLTRLARSLLVDADLERDRPRAVHATRLALREVEVLEHAARGRSTDVTASLLGVKASTIQRHRRRAIGKLGARNITHAVAIAHRQGIPILP